MAKPTDLAERMGLLGTETAFDVLVRARALEARGREIIHLEIGEPDFSTPSHIVQAAVDALAAGETHYGPALGLPALREAIAAHVAETRGLAVEPGQVAVTPGGKPILFFTLLAVAQPGDEVLLPDPGFPIYESMARFVGAQPVPLGLDPARGFRLDPAQVAERLGPRTRLLILNSPHNPTGAALSADDLAGLAQALARWPRVLVLSDEIYSRVLYEGQHHSIAAQPGMAERTVILDGFSKAYAMTGWRLGYGVFPKPLVPAIERLIVNSVSCTSGAVQRAGLAALAGPQQPVERMVAELRRRRDALVAGLNRLPDVACGLPQGAFYAFPRLAVPGRTSKELADWLLEEAGVAVLPGTAFGPAGEGFLRLSYGTGLEHLQRALEKLSAVSGQWAPLGEQLPT
ncbi:MAG: pyridoxal phosphate-dependent aminotransferase [Chloroflexi bacterium]|nr:pyridoxal phosphate-dependent aminotransferase [Chloroflexota bacterium]